MVASQCVFLLCFVSKQQRQPGRVSVPLNFSLLYVPLRFSVANSDLPCIVICPP